MNMKRIGLWLSLALTTCTFAEYTEVMKADAPRVSVAEFGLTDDGGRSDQSAVLQQAIDQTAEKGGGAITVPKGTYLLNDVALKSNIHLLIEAGTVIRVPRDEKTGSGKWAFSVGRDGPVENVSIRGVGGRYTVDLRNYRPRDRVRVMALGDVTNFLVADLEVQDNFTTFSSILMSTPESEKTGFVGPTDGTIRDCATYHASNGYGLVQSHAAKRVLYENLYALGGVAMRLECGVRPKSPRLKNGLFDLKGRNIRCEDGYVALLMGPHSTPCGVVEVDGIESVGCEFAVKLTGGFISKRKQHEGDKNGFFEEGTVVRNIHAVFGEHAQLSPKHLPYLPVELRGQVRPNMEQHILYGPSITAVCNHSNYPVKIENVTFEGFRNIKPVVAREDAHTDEAVKAMVKKYRSNDWKE